LAQHWPNIGPTLILKKWKVLFFSYNLHLKIWILFLKIRLNRQTLNECKNEN
jgi:hypothetical protein